MAEETPKFCGGSEPLNLTRRLLVVLPGLLAAEGEVSLLREAAPDLRRIAESAHVVRLRADSPEGIAEAAWLGLNPEQVSMPMGPLTVAGLGADPPERSVEFRLDLLNVDDLGIVNAHPGELDAASLRVLREAVSRLETPKLRWVDGFDRVHGLVWLQGSPDHETTPPDAAHEQSLPTVLPNGDQDYVLRRFIDDSVNLLSPLEFNNRRHDEGKPLINLAWPSGGGWRASLPNLMLRRGAPGRVGTRSLVTAGLARMVGYRAMDRNLLGNGFFFDSTLIAGDLARVPVSLLELDFIRRARQAGRYDPAGRTLHEQVDPLLAHWTTARDEESVSLAILALDATGREGLGLFWDSERAMEENLPFDERVMDDGRVPEHTLWRWVDQFFAG